jgi:hypothetical protein
MIRNRLSDQFSIFVMRIRDPGPGERDAQRQDPDRAGQRSPELKDRSSRIRIPFVTRSELLFRAPEVLCRPAHSCELKNEH